MAVAARAQRVLRAIAGLARRHNVIPIVYAPDYVERADAVITCDDNTFSIKPRARARDRARRRTHAAAFILRAATAATG